MSNQGEQDDGKGAEYQAETADWRILHGEEACGKVKVRVGIYQ